MVIPRYLSTNRTVRRPDNSPGANISRRVDVGVCAMAASPTLKPALTGTIAFPDMPAGMAALRRVARVDRDHGYARPRCFVLDKRAQLRKAPVRQALTLLFVGLNPLADVLEVLKRNRRTGAFSSFNDGLADAMVLVFLKARLAAPEPAQLAPGGARAFALQALSAMGVFAPAVLDRFAVVAAGVAVGGDIDNPHVDAEHIGYVEFTGIRHLADTGDVEHPIDPHQINFAFAVLEQRPLVLAIDAGDGLAARKRPDTDGLIGFEPENPLIKCLGGVVAKPARGLFRVFAAPFAFRSFDFVSIGHLGDAAHGYLCANTKPFPTVPIHPPVQRKLPKRLRLERLPANPVARLVAALKRGLQRLVLLRRGLKLDIRDQLHSIKYRTNREQNHLTLTLEAAIPLPAKAGSLLAKY